MTAIHILCVSWFFSSYPFHCAPSRSFSNHFLSFPFFSFAGKRLGALQIPRQAPLRCQSRPVPASPILRFSPPRNSVLFDSVPLPVQSGRFKSSRLNSTHSKTIAAQYSSIRRPSLAAPVSSPRPNLIHYVSNLLFAFPCKSIAFLLNSFPRKKSLTGISPLPKST